MMIGSQWRCRAGLWGGVAVAMALGAATSVAVAWRLWRTVEPSRLIDANAVFALDEVYNGRRANWVWLVTCRSGLGWSQYIFDGHGANVDRLLADTESWLTARDLPWWVRHPGQVQTPRTEAYGLPFCCLYGWTSALDPAKFPPPGDWRPRNVNSTDRPPLSGIVWDGLALNVLVYGAAWWVAVMWVARPLVRRRRRKHGRCGECNYDLRGLPENSGCPECGWGRP